VDGTCVAFPKTPNPDNRGYVTAAARFQKHPEVSLTSRQKETESFFQTVKGKPHERVGRKATGLHLERDQVAGLPVNALTFAGSCACR
jgi:hypothetical protein